jgi:hypothetical protein
MFPLSPAKTSQAESIIRLPLLPRSSRLACLPNQTVMMVGKDLLNLKQTRLSRQCSKVNKKRPLSLRNLAARKLMTPRFVVASLA